MGSMASQITSLTIVYSAVHLGTDQRKHQSSASRAFVRGIHRGPVNSPHKWPVKWKMFPFDDVIMSAFSLNFQVQLKGYHTMIKSQYTNYVRDNLGAMQTIGSFYQQY